MVDYISKLRHKTKIGGYNEIKDCDPQGRQKVFFTCHPDDFITYFDSISDEILKIQPGCDVCFYHPEEDLLEEERSLDLQQMVMLVIPVTSKFIDDDNCSARKDFEYAKSNHIPVLLLQQKYGIEKSFNEKCGSYQMLFKEESEEKSDYYDSTVLDYNSKLTQFLESALIGQELVERINNEFNGKIFLSYRKKDRKYANELIRRIHNYDFCRDISIWYDEYLVSGENFNQAIEKAMEDSQFIIFLVTPNITEIFPDGTENYCLREEYHKAKSMNQDSGVSVFPVEFENTDDFCEKYIGFPEPINVNDEAFSKTLKKEVDEQNTINKKSAEHDYLIGLAYLNGINVEVNRDRALALISSAAKSGLTEAIDKIIDIYYHIGELKKAIEWIEYAYSSKNTFSNHNFSTDAKCATILCQMGEYGEAYSLTLSSLNDIIQSNAISQNNEIPIIQLISLYVMSGLRSRKIIDDAEEAIELYEHVIDAYKSALNKDGLILLAKAYHNMSEIMIFSDNFDEAYKYAKESFNIRKNYFDCNSVFYIRGELAVLEARCFLDDKNCKKCEELFIKVFNIVEKEGENYYLSKTLLDVYCICVSELTKVKFKKIRDSRSSSLQKTILASMEKLNAIFEYEEFRFDWLCNTLSFYLLFDDSAVTLYHLMEELLPIISDEKLSSDQQISTINSAIRYIHERLDSGKCTKRVNDFFELIYPYCKKYYKSNSINDYISFLENFSLNSYELGVYYLDIDAEYSTKCFSKTIEINKEFFGITENTDARNKINAKIAESYMGLGKNQDLILSKQSYKKAVRILKNIDPRLILIGGKKRDDILIDCYIQLSHIADAEGKTNECNGYIKKAEKLKNLK